MRTLLAVICAAILSSVPLLAKADNCALLVAKIVQQEGAKFVSFSPSGNIAFLTHPLAAEISVDCGANSIGTMLNVNLDHEPFPDEAVFHLVARLGVLLIAMKENALLKVLHSCHQQALKDTQAEMAERYLNHGVEVECHAFTRDGGASAFTISTDVSK